jgi:hypothetical protein
MERTHLLKRDLDWLPPSYRAIRNTVAGGVWTVVVGGLLGLSVFGHVHMFGLIGPMLTMGGYLGGGRAARGVLRGRLRKLATGAVDLSKLPTEPDGELVHVAGKVRALGGKREVYERSVFSFDGFIRVVHVRAENFWLVGDAGEPVLVEVEDARLLADGKEQMLDSDDARVRSLEVLPLPRELDRFVAQRAKRRGKGKKPRKVRLAEYALVDGASVEVVGYKSRTIDPTIATRLERDTPFRATLKGGRNLPLLIAPRPA